MELILLNAKENLETVKNQGATSTKGGEVKILIKKKKMIALISIVVISSTILGTSVLAQKTQQSNGQPFQELWNAIFGLQDDIGDLQPQLTDLQTQINDSQTQVSELQSQIDDLQTQLDDLHAENETIMRTVIEGSFNVTEDGDIIEVTESGDELHWKNITVEELTFSDMPLIDVYVKPNNNTVTTPEDMWRNAGEGLGDQPTAYAVFDEQSVLIFYKRILNDGTENYFMNGDYKIVVVK